MSRLLIDTTCWIDAERAGGTLDTLIDDEDDIAISAVTVAELRVGILLATGKRRAERAAFVTDVLATVPVVDYDTDVAAVHAVLLAAVRRQGRPHGAHDLLIAATAVASGRELVTADGRAFADLPGLRLAER